MNIFKELSRLLGPKRPERAMVCRVLLSPDGSFDLMNGLSQTYLRPGEGRVFRSDGDIVGFAQSGTPLPIIDEGGFELLAVLDRRTGGLLLTTGREENSIGFNHTIPHERRAVTFEVGKARYGVIWGETRKEVRATLSRLQAGRTQGN